MIALVSRVIVSTTERMEELRFGSVESCHPRTVRFTCVLVREYSSAGEAALELEKGIGKVLVEWAVNADPEFLRDAPRSLLRQWCHREAHYPIVKEVFSPLLETL